MSILDYKNYFRNIAIKHKKILHDPTSEGPNGIVAKRKFTCFNMDEVVKGARSNIGGGPVLHLHNYEWKLLDNGAFNTKGIYTGGFLITNNAKSNDAESEESALILCETIAWDIIGKMYKDFQSGGETCDTALGRVVWDSLSVSPTGRLWENRVGWWVEFQFDKSVNDNISEESVNLAFL